MNIDSITDIEELRQLLKTQMVKIKRPIKTPTCTHEPGEWFFIIQDNDEVFLYEKNPMLGIMLDYNEANEIIDWKE